MDKKNRGEAKNETVEGKKKKKKKKAHPWGVEQGGGGF